VKQQVLHVLQHKFKAASSSTKQHVHAEWPAVHNKQGL
jgi:hypothetical protein